MNQSLTVDDTLQQKQLQCV